MKNILPILLLCVSFSHAQTKSELHQHYETFYSQMKTQGDVNGIINALTHLNIISPSVARKDTLAYVYANNGQHLQALNTIGVEKNDTDSNLAVQIKAISLKAINQPKRAIEQFEVLFKKTPSPFIAYELADLKIMTGDYAGSTENITYGLANITNDMKYAFYERQQPYEASLKASFMHLKALAQFQKDQNIDAALTTINKALEIDPSFNLASLTKQALETRKENPEGK